MMQVRLSVCATLLAAGLVLLATSDSQSADSEKEMRAGVLKLADALEKKDKNAKKMAEDLAKKIDDLEELMHVFSLRTAKGGGVGVGSKAGAISPDGIEQQIITLGKKPLDKAKLDAEADDLVRMAYVAAAVGEITIAKPPLKDEGKKKKKDWIKFSEDSKTAALELAAAAKGKDPAAVHAAAKKLDSKCDACHDIFKGK
jgi:cytochrome c556